MMGNGEFVGRGLLEKRESFFSHPPVFSEFVGYVIPSIGWVVDVWRNVG